MKIEEGFSFVGKSQIFGSIKVDEKKKILPLFEKKKVNFI